MKKSHKAPQRRVIEGVRLAPDGLLPGESRVPDWPGGELRVVVRRPMIVEGVPWSQLPIEETELGRGSYVAFGDGLALPTEPVEWQFAEAPGFGFEIGIRNGRPRCVAIRSLEGGPPITTTLLKSGRLPPIGRLVREAVVESTVRVVRTTEAGEIIGVHVWSTPDVRMSYEVRRVGTDDELDELENRERRWRMTDDHLHAVAKVYREALSQDKPTAREIAKSWGTSEQNARRWVAKARQRGFLPKTEARQARG